MTTVLMLGSAPNALLARTWPRAPFDSILVINNAHLIRPDWDIHIHPWDFPEDRRPQPGPGQQTILQDRFVPAQNAYGGFVCAGGTMAFTAAYWALHALRPRVLAVLGCDMTYAASGATHFYGTGTPDPLRPDITLRDLEAKSARLEALAALQDCALVNLSTLPSRLIAPRATPGTCATARPRPPDPTALARAQSREAKLNYTTPTGRYWEDLSRFDPAEIDALDSLWRACYP